VLVPTSPGRFQGARLGRPPEGAGMATIQLMQMAGAS
jgi:hypothetical protein